MGRFISLLRCSTDEQAISGHGLNAQSDACNAYAISMGSKVELSFSDEGVSGATSIDKRPGLLAAIDSLRKDDVLLVAKRDRIGRDPLVVALVEAAVARKGAKIVSVAGEGTENDEPTSILMRRIVDSFSEYERLIIKARVKSALQAKKRRNERVGHIPFGFELADDKVHLVPSKAEMEILQTIQSLRRKKISLRKIALELNEGCFSNRGNKWNPVSVYRVSRGKVAA